MALLRAPWHLSSSPGWKERGFRDWRDVWGRHRCSGWIMLRVTLCFPLLAAPLTSVLLSVICDKSALLTWDLLAFSLWYQTSQIEEFLITLFDAYAFFTLCRFLSLAPSINRKSIPLLNPCLKQLISLLCQVPDVCCTFLPPLSADLISSCFLLANRSLPQLWLCCPPAPDLSHAQSVYKSECSLKYKAVLSLNFVSVLNLC